MVIKLLLNQIPRFWEAIKFASVSAEDVKEEDRRDYLNNLLHSLLNDKSQCFVGLDDERKLLGVAVTQLVADKTTGSKDLFLKVLYSWKYADIEEWKDRLNLVKDFAKSEGCKHIYFESRNPRVWQVGEAVGFKEHFRTFRMEV